MRILILFILFSSCLMLNAIAEHEHHAPHQGTLIVMGKEFAHLELVLDSPSGSLTAYSLDGEAENAVVLTQAVIDVQITLRDGQVLDVPLKAVENPLTAEVVGNTSEFRGQAEQLKGVAKFNRKIRLVSTKGETFKEVVFAYPEGNEQDENKT